MSKIRRNDPCPCGSGKKYKKCHGPLDEKQERINTMNTELYRLHHDLVSLAVTTYKNNIDQQLQQFQQPASILDDETKEIYHTGLTPWIMSSVPIFKDHETLLENFYHSKQKGLSPHMRDILTEWLHAEPSFYEVVSINSPKEQFMVVQELGDDETLLIPIQDQDDFVEGSLLIGTVIPFMDHHNFLLTMVKLYERDKDHYTKLLQQHKNKQDGLTDAFPDLLAEALSSEFIDTKWQDDAHEEVVRLLIDRLSNKGISDRVITETISEWHTFCERENPTIKKIEPYAAAMDYYIQKAFLKDSESTQATVAKEYETSPSTLSNIYRRITQTLENDKS